MAEPLPPCLHCAIHEAIEAFIREHGDLTPERILWALQVVAVDIIRAMAVRMELEPDDEPEAVEGLETRH